MALKKVNIDACFDENSPGSTTSFLQQQNIQDCNSNISKSTFQQQGNIHVSSQFVDISSTYNEKAHNDILLGNLHPTSASPSTEHNQQQDCQYQDNILPENLTSDQCITSDLHSYNNDHIQHPEKDLITLAFITLTENYAFLRVTHKNKFTFRKTPYIVKQFMTTRRKLQSTITKRMYILMCKKADICPSFLKIKGTKGNNYRHVIRKAEKAMISNHIQVLNNNIDLLNKKSYYLYKIITTKCEFWKINIKLKTVFCNIAQDSKSNIKKLEHRIEWLKNKNMRIQCNNRMHIEIDTNNTNNESISIPNNTTGFINLSDFEPNTKQLEILKYGPKHGLKVIPKPQKIIPQIEFAIKHTPKEDQLKFRKLAIDILKQSTQSYDPDLAQLRKLKTNKNVRILKADKANSLVMLNECDYKEKLAETLTQLKIEPVHEDPKQNLIKGLLNLKRLKHLPLQLKEHCVPPPCPAIPRLFLQIKTHKPNKPLRPVVANYSSFTARAEKALLHLLNEVFPSPETTVQSSTQAANIISSTKLQPSAKLYSMDVKSLFPSVSIPLTRRIIINTLTNSSLFSKKEISAIDKLLSFVLNSAFFKLDNVIYRQIDGAAMGSSLSAKLGEIFLTYFEKIALNRSPLKPQLLLKYVDDYLIIWEHGDAAFRDFVKLFNSLHTNLELTIEEENNLHQLPFLDLLLTRTSNHIDISIHRKSCAITNPPSVSSYQHPSHKLAFFHSSLHRAFNLPLSSSARSQEVQFIHNLYIQAGHPEASFRKLLNKHSKIVSFPTNLQPDMDKTPKKFIPIYYVKELTNWYHRLANKLPPDTRLTFKTSLKTESMVVMDRDFVSANSGVYAIPILQETSEGSIPKLYIGQTARDILIRSQEHQLSIEKCKTHLLASTPCTSLTNFYRQNQCSILWKDIKILDSTSNHKELLWIESIWLFWLKDFIINDHPSLDIPQEWSNFLLTHRNSNLRSSKILPFISTHSFQKQSFQVDQDVINLFCKSFAPLLNL